jgi:hypothetical protein
VSDFIDEIVTKRGPEFALQVAQTEVVRLQAEVERYRERERLSYAERDASWARIAMLQDANSRAQDRENKLEARIEELKAELKLERDPTPGRRKHRAQQENIQRTEFTVARSHVGALLTVISMSNQMVGSRIESRAIDAAQKWLDNK